MKHAAFRGIIAALVVAFATSAFVGGTGSAKPQVKSKPKSHSASASPAVAFALYRSGKWEAAEQAFKQCVADEPFDPSLAYYLGTSALCAKHYDVAERAFCRAIVESPPNTQFAKLAQNSLTGWRSQFHGLSQPYSEQPEGFMRWKKGSLIKVCVTDGLQLPPGFVGSELSVDKCRMLYGPMKNPAFFARLKQAPGYVSTYRDAVISGITDWRFVEKDGLAKIEMIDDPSRADVVYIWCKQHGGGHVGMAYYPWHGVADSRCIVEVETDSPNSWGANAVTELRHTSAHEFGHVLGLATHSPNPSDVMGASRSTISYWQSRQYSNTSPITRNDFVTLRALYELPVQCFEPNGW